MFHIVDSDCSDELGMYDKVQVKQKTVCQKTIKMETSDKETHQFEKRFLQGKCKVIKMV